MEIINEYLVLDGEEIKKVWLTMTSTMNKRYFIEVDGYVKRKQIDIIEFIEMSEALEKSTKF